MLPIKLSAPAIGGFSVGLMLLGLYGMWVESRPFLTTVGMARTRAASVIDAPEVPFLSSKRALGVFEFDCRTLAFGTEAATLAPDEHKAAVAGCYERARSLVEAAPGNSRLWLTLAQFAFNAGQPVEIVHAAIAASRATGRWQYSLAKDRTALIARLPEVPPAIADVDQQDLITLAASRNGRDLLAQRYIDRPADRDRITAAIETQSPGEQANFLNRVRRKLQ